MKKKKILFQSDYSLAKTGFGRNARAILSYLFKTGKYEIVHYSCGINYSHPQLKKTPWKSIGTLPDDEAERKSLERDPSLSRMASYGDYNLNKVIEAEAPDVYIAAQDIWGVDFALKKPWFNKIPSVIWTTLDSLPILPTALDAAKKIENYWIWSSFATKALHEKGHTHVKTMHGAVDASFFYRLTDDKRKELRIKASIPSDCFVIGFVFRNQLRKSVPNLLEGFSEWKKQNPTAQGKLFFHTHFTEGWDIPKLAGEYGINSEDILATYICKTCNRYSVKPFIGEGLNCPFCKASKSTITTNTVTGVTEEELNEIYNLMDVYCHPFTSGGQEFPIQEAKLTELITLVTSYSCGEEMCEEGAASLPLDWNEYREHGTQFIKASTKPSSIAKQINKVFKMKPKTKRKLEKQARQWVLDNFSVETVGKKIEKFLDALPETKYKYIPKDEEQKDPYFLIPEIKDDSEWIKFLYKNILKMKVDDENEGHKYWVAEIEKGAVRQDIENYFRNVALKEEQQKQMKFEEFLDDDQGRRMVYVMPESIGDIYMSTSLFKSLKETYPDYNLYVATKPEYFPLLTANPHVHKAIPYVPQMEDILFLEGQGSNLGHFEIAFMPFVSTQRQMTYPHNGKDKIAFKDYKYA